MTVTISVRGPRLEFYLKLFEFQAALYGIVRGIVTRHNKAIKNQKLAVALLPTFGAIAKSGSARQPGRLADETKEL